MAEHDAIDDEDERLQQRMQDRGQRETTDLARELRTARTPETIEPEDGAKRAQATIKSL